MPQRLCGHLEYSLNRRVGVPHRLCGHLEYSLNRRVGVPEIVWTFGVPTEQEGGSARDCVDIWSTN